MPMWLQALRAVVLLWGCELALARFSSVPQTWGDIAISAAGLVLLGVAPVPLLTRAPLPKPLGRALLRLIAFGPLLVVAFVIALPGIAHLVGPPAVALILALGGLFSLVAMRSRGAGAPFPSAPLLLLVMGVAVSVAWAAQAAELPPLSVVIPIAAVWTALALLVSWPRWIPVGVALVLIVVRLPEPPPAVAWRTTAATAGGPDILLLTVDTLRADVAAEMASYRKLAEAGVTFQAAQAPSPWTLPSMATGLSGLLPAEHGARRLGREQFATIGHGVQTLATRLAENGYDTAAVVGPNLFVGRSFGFDRGFALFYHAGERNRFALPQWVTHYRIWGGRPVLAEAITSLGIVDRRAWGDANELVQTARHVLETRRERPIFLWVHFFDPHLPYAHMGETDLSRATKRALNAAAGPREIERDPRWSSRVGRAALWTAYTNEVQHTDRAILRLLEQLGDPPARGRIVVLTSDHGEEFFEHGGFEHGHALYQEVVAVPLVISGLGGAREPGSVEGTPVGLVDLPTTLLAAAGISDPTLRGQDLGGDVELRRYTSENLLYGDSPEEASAAREGDWKVITRHDQRLELYDLASDPGESRNLAALHAELARRLIDRERPASTASRPVSLTEQEKAALRGLGYLDD